MEKKELTVEEVKICLDKTEKGGIMSSIGNCVKILTIDPVMAGAIKYNIMTERIVVKNIGREKMTPVLTDTDINFVILYFEQNYGINNRKNIVSALDIVSDRNRYHPVRDILNTLIWDGEERIRYCLHHFLGAEQNDYVYEVFKLFLLGAISRVFHPGCKFDYMLCLVGGQRAGKSTLFRFLSLEDEYFTDDLKRLDDEKIYSRLQGHWVIEMSEMLAMVNAKSVEELKSFISRTKEIYRTPYATQPQDRLRQCVFAG